MPIPPLVSREKGEQKGQPREAISSHKIPEMKFFEGDNF